VKAKTAGLLPLGGTDLSLFYPCLGGLFNFSIIVGVGFCYYDSWSCSVYSFNIISHNRILLIKFFDTFIIFLPSTV
jgi:hypothetical protein